MEYNKSSNQSRSKCIMESTHISPSLHFTGGRCLLLLLSLVAAPVAGRNWPARAARRLLSPALPKGAAGRTEAAGAVGWEEEAAVGRSSSKADRGGRALQRGECRRQVAGRRGRHPDPVGAGWKERAGAQMCAGGEGLEGEKRRVSG